VTEYLRRLDEENDPPAEEEGPLDSEAGEPAPGSVLCCRYEAGSRPEQPKVERPFGNNVRA
jgi:hypothetical protein